MPEMRSPPRLARIAQDSPGAPGPGILTGRHGRSCITGGSFLIEMRENGERATGAVGRELHGATLGDSS